MSEVTRIHRGKQPRRPHFIKEWMERRHLRPVDLAVELGADPSVVSRWLSGGSPALDYQEKLSALFQIDRDGIFRHPDDDWITRFLHGRSPAEVERIKATLEAAFPAASPGQPGERSPGTSHTPASGAASVIQQVVQAGTSPHPATNPPSAPLKPSKRAGYK